MVEKYFIDVTSGELRYLEVYFEEIIKDAPECSYWQKASMYYAWVGFQDESRLKGNALNIKVLLRLMPMPSRPGFEESSQTEMFFYLKTRAGRPGYIVGYALCPDRTAWSMRSAQAERPFNSA